MTLLVSLLAALIGAFSALITTFLKEVVFQRLNEARSKTNQQREIFRNYAAPLAAATEKLIWRFFRDFPRESGSIPEESDPTRRLQRV